MLNIEQNIGRGIIDLNSSYRGSDSFFFERKTDVICLIILLLLSKKTDVISLIITWLVTKIRLIINYAINYTGRRSYNFVKRL